MRFRCAVCYLYCMTDAAQRKPSKRTRSRYQPRNGRWIKREIRLALYVRDGFRCLYCGKDLRHTTPCDVTLDHLLPRSAGGGDEATNLVTCCRSCNSSRKDRPWVDYAPGGARERIEQLRYEPLNLELARALIAGTAGDPELEALR